MPSKPVCFREISRKLLRMEYQAQHLECGGLIKHAAARGRGYEEDFNKPGTTAGAALGSAPGKPPLHAEELLAAV